MSDERVPVFPLVPRRRFDGVSFGSRRSPRRGPGDEVAGTRPYVPGDRIAWIDWHATAALSSAHGSDELVVRQFFADEAPRIALVCDRRPSLALYRPPSPWLDKGAALAAAAETVAASAFAARGELAYLDYAEGRPFWLPPTRRGRLADVRRRERDVGFDAPPDGLDRALSVLIRHGDVLPVGSFVFIVSDFLAPAAARWWATLRARRWDVVPIVVQDPVWERSFPAVGGVELPLVDPVSGRSVRARLTPREARVRAQANEARFRSLLERFAGLGFDPLALDVSERHAVGESFLAWAMRRKALRSRRV
jgi:uncharacterized protein (DUF58 family)